MLTSYRLPQTLSDRKIHTCCCVIMQSSAFKRKTVTPSRAALCPSKSSLLVMTEMSAMYQRRVVSRGLHTWLHAVRHLLFLPPPHHEYGYFSHKWGGFVFCFHPQAGLAMTCLRRGRAQFFTRWFFCCFISRSLCSCFLPSAVMTVTNHRVETFLFFFFLRFCTSCRYHHY